MCTSLDQQLTKMCTLDHYMAEKVSHIDLPTKQDDSFDGMHFHLLRLSTFKDWPNWDSANPLKLARNGFYATGKGDEVQCYSCHIRLDDWRAGDDPLERHKQTSPLCRFLSSGHRNIGLLDKTGDHDDIEMTDDHNRPGCSKKQKMNESRGDQVDGANAAVASNRMHSNPLSATASTSAAEVNERHNSAPARLLPTYQLEKTRLQTFTKWPTSAAISPFELAQAGFIYLNKDDMVKCVFCQGVLQDWQAGERAFVKHQKEFPACAFVQDPQKVSQLAGKVECKGTAAAVSTKETAELARLHALGIETDLPKRHDMALYVVRLESFTRWPMQTLQKPRVLAEAGFYYNSHGDSVSCYWCGGGLRNWEPTDDPWVLHTLQFPKCGHLKRTKGEEFVEYVTTHGRVPSDYNAISVQLDEVTACMETEIVRNVLSMGFDSTFVKEVIAYRLASYGNSFTTTEGLLNSILNFKESRPSDFPVHISSVPEPTPPVIPPEQEINNTQATKPSKKKKKRNRKSKASAAATSEQSDTTNDDSPTDQHTECRVCMDKSVAVLFLPCRHLVCCVDCSTKVSQCPLCRMNIEATINVFMG